MHPTRIVAEDLEAYLDEALPPVDMARIEHALRTDESLRKQLQLLASRMDLGAHSLGAIWRRGRFCCPKREELGGLLLETLEPAHAEYLRFHLETVGCRYCQANLADLQNQQREPAGVSDSRRKKYFQSSAGYLRKP